MRASYPLEPTQQARIFNEVTMEATMAHDPYGRPVRRDYNSPWTWIIGIAALLVLGIIVWAAVGNNTNMASKDNATESRPAPSTTGSAPSPGTTGAGTAGQKSGAK